MPVTVPDRPYHGPYLRFHDYDAQSNTWACSVMYVLRQFAPGSPAPLLTLADGPTTSQWPGYEVDAFEGWQCWRFNIRTQLTQLERQLLYWLTMTPELPGNKQYSFMIPGLGAPLHWGFRSCDWFSGGVDQVAWGGHTPVWKDMLEVHARKPLHVMIGGGDQIYQDPVMEEVPQLRAWSQLSDRNQRQNASFTPELKQACERYYFYHYLEIFGKECMAEIYASVPQILIWDDHDIIDGWGSYPTPLQTCPVFQGLFGVAQRFYLLFQHQTSVQLAYTEGAMFGDMAFNFVRCIHPEVAVLGVDMRCRRTIQQIVTPSNYDMCFHHLEALHGGIKHLILISAVPMAYPELPGSELTLKMLSGMSKENMLNNLMGKTGLSSKIMKFDEPELLDDLRDHWGSSSHKKEREMFLSRLQQFAVDRACRVSIISGDVHLAAFGLFYSHPKMADPKFDPKWMVNATSSASVNPPPPNALVKMLTSANHASTLDAIKTKEKMIRVFAKRNPASDKLLARRNWCSVSLSPTSTGAAGNMLFELRAEYDVNTKGTYKLQPFETFHVDVPPLVTKPAKAGLPPPICPVPAPLPGTVGPPLGSSLTGPPAAGMQGYQAAPTRIPDPAMYQGTGYLGGPTEPMLVTAGRPSSGAALASGNSFIEGPPGPTPTIGRPSVGSGTTYGMYGTSSNMSQSNLQPQASAPPYDASAVKPAAGGSSSGIPGRENASTTPSMYPPAPSSGGSTAGYGQSTGTAAVYSSSLAASPGTAPVGSGTGGVPVGYGQQTSSAVQQPQLSYQTSTVNTGGLPPTAQSASTLASQQPSYNRMNTGPGGTSSMQYGPGAPATTQAPVGVTTSGGQSMSQGYPQGGSCASVNEATAALGNISVGGQGLDKSQMSQYPNMSNRPGGSAAAGSATMQAGGNQASIQGQLVSQTAYPQGGGSQGSAAATTGYPGSQGGGAQGTIPGATGYPGSQGGGAQGTTPGATGFPGSQGSSQGATMQSGSQGGMQGSVQSATGYPGSPGGPPPTNSQGATMQSGPQGGMQGTVQKATGYPGSQSVGQPGMGQSVQHGTPYSSAATGNSSAGGTMYSQAPSHSGSGMPVSGPQGPPSSVPLSAQPYGASVGGLQHQASQQWSSSAASYAGQQYASTQQMTQPQANPYGSPSMPPVGSYGRPPLQSMGSFGGPDQPNPYGPPMGMQQPPANQFTGGMYPTPTTTYPQTGAYPNPNAAHYPSYNPQQSAYPAPGSASYPQNYPYPGYQPPPGGPSC